MKKKSEFIGRVLALAAVVACATAAMAQSAAVAKPAAGAKAAPATAKPKEAEPGVIKVGKVSDITDVNAPKGIASEAAVRAVFDRVNAAGGINGKKLELVVADDKYKADNAAAEVKKLIARGDILALVAASGTGPTKAMLPIITEAKLPLIGTTSGAIARTEKTASRYFFNVRSSNYDDAKGFTSFLKVNGDKRMSIVYQDDAFGKDGLDSAIQAAKEDGVEIVDKLAMPANAAPEKVLQIAKSLVGSNAGNAIVFLIDRPAANLFKSLRALESKMRTACVTSCGSFDQEMDANQLEGVIVSSFGPTLADSASPVIIKFRETMMASKFPISPPALFNSETTPLG
jgi:ABC-type branched-subunit amino acid transport system substrate-binding protein